MAYHFHLILSALLALSRSTKVSFNCIYIYIYIIYGYIISYMNILFHVCINYICREISFNSCTTQFNMVHSPICIICSQLVAKALLPSCIRLVVQSSAFFITSVKIQRLVVRLWLYVAKLRVSSERCTPAN